MSEKHYRTVIVDPLTETFEEYQLVKKEPIWPRIRQVLGYDTTTLVAAPGREHAFVVDDEGLLHDDANDRKFFRPSFHYGPICGRAMLIGLTPHEGDFTDCSIPLEAVKQLVEFPKVRFVGLKESEGFTVIPGLGEVPTLRREAMFVNIGEEDSSATH